MTDASLAEENARLQALLAETQAALAESEEARQRALISDNHPGRRRQPTWPQTSGSGVARP